MTFGRFLNEAQSHELIAAGGQLNPNQRVSVSQVVTDQALVERAQHLEATLQSGQLAEFCNYKVENAQSEKQASVWRFIQATFNADKNKSFLQLLGFDEQTLSEKIDRVSVKEELKSDLANEFENSIKLNDSAFDKNELAKDEFAQIARSFSPLELDAGDDSVEAVISDNLLLGRYHTVVDLCIQQNRFTDAILVASFFDKDLLAKVQKTYFNKNKNKFTKVKKINF